MDEILSLDQKREIVKLIEEKLQSYIGEHNIPPGLIKSRHIDSITWNQGQGGTLILGGLADVSGVFSLVNASSVEIISMTKDGLILKDSSGNTIVTLDADGIAVAATGDITVGGDSLNTNAEVFSHLSIEHYWTPSNTYIDRVGCNFALNGDNFTNQNVYFECVMANEQASRTAYTQIYNITDTATLASSEITSTADPLTSLERVRSSALTIPSGLKEYKIQIKMNQAGGEGDNAHYYAARLVITQT